MQETAQDEQGANSGSQEDEQVGYHGNNEQDRKVQEIGPNCQAAESPPGVDQVQADDSSAVPVVPGVAGEQIASAVIHDEDGASAGVEPIQTEDRNEVAVDRGTVGGQITSAVIHGPEIDDGDGAEIQVNEQQPLIQN